MPSCQSAVCTNRIAIPSLLGDPGRRSPGTASLGLPAEKSGDLNRQVRDSSDASYPGVTSVTEASGRSGCRNLDRVSDHDRTLVLLRHAKSAYPAGVADHDRPLAPRGKRQAGLAGDWLRAHLPTVDAVL